MPFPKPETTPPVTNTYFGIRLFLQSDTNIPVLSYYTMFPVQLQAHFSDVLGNPFWDFFGKSWVSRQQ